MGFLVVISEYTGFFFSFLCLYVQCECCLSVTLGETYLQGCCCSVPVLHYLSWSLLKFMSIEAVMLSKHLVLHSPLLLLPSVFPSIRVFSN